jgi:hypothetical protein
MSETVVFTEVKYADKHERNELPIAFKRMFFYYYYYYYYYYY